MSEVVVQNFYFDPSAPNCCCEGVQSCCCNDMPETLYCKVIFWCVDETDPTPCPPAALIQKTVYFEMVAGNYEDSICSGGEYSCNSATWRGSYDVPYCPIGGGGLDSYTVTFDLCCLKDLFKTPPILSIGGAFYSSLGGSSNFTIKDSCEPLPITLYYASCGGGGCPWIQLIIQDTSF